MPEKFISKLLSFYDDGIEPNTSNLALDINVGFYQRLDFLFS
ncbi:hypothetical protein ROA7745_03881 [Roseovarius aestuarii]|uniref:Uncharacterized protein n=1 Tax=Roseovarius aestuarii TaxID=475083 RepID=A0A1X7BXM5_9RHOB|nr:hypothetical protein ROA7745_03881 [Roseovarius aestuarii]